MINNGENNDFSNLSTIQNNKENINLNSIDILKNEIDSNRKNIDNTIELSKLNDIQLTFDNKSKNIIKPSILEDIKFGIDENGNPIDINEYYKNINNKNGNKKKRPIAYIVKDKNNDNILVDLNGNKILEKNKDGDYEFPFQFKILIKAFDVQHPELRINGERLYTNEENNTIQNDNNIKEKNENNKEEISFQLDSTETNDSTSYKINNSKINCLFKKNNWNKKKFIEFWKLGYGNNNLKENNDNNHDNKIISTEKSKKFVKIKNTNYNNKEIKNYSFNKKKETNQEIISRTHSILNVNNTIDAYYNNSSPINDLDSINRNHLKRKNNNYINKYKNNIRINKENFPKDEIPFSPIKKINIIKSYNNQNKIKFHNNRVIRTSILSNNPDQIIIKNNNHSKKKFTNPINNYYINNSVNKFKEFSTLVTSPSLIINKNKMKQLFKDNNYNNHSFSNITRNENDNRIKNNLMNKNLLIKLSNKQKIKKLNEENLPKNNYQNNNTINNEHIYSHDNIIDKKVDLKNKKVNPSDISDIRSIEFSETSINEIFKNENNEKKGNKIDNDEKYKNQNNINKINNNKKCKLIKRIPINPKHKILNENKKYSVLTKEANNMIKKYILNKNIIINQKTLLKISFRKDSNKNKLNLIINKKNRSFNKDKRNKKLCEEFN